MKRTLAIVCAVMLLAATGAFAAQPGGFAIGGEGALYFAGSGGLPTYAMLTLHIPRFPLMLGIGITTSMALGLTADYWLADGNLVSIFDWYVGIGGYLALDPNGGDIAAGGRIPIGLQIWPIRKAFEIFVEVAPAVGISIVPTGFDWHFQGALGFRFWF